MLFMIDDSLFIICHLLLLMKYNQWDIIINFPEEKKIMRHQYLEWRLRIRINPSAASCRHSTMKQQNLPEMQVQTQTQMHTPRGFDALLSCTRSLSSS